MPARKKEVKEEEVQIDISEKKTTETFVTRWFKDNAVNNQSELKIVCDLTSRSAEEQFCMYTETGNTELYSLIFYATFMSILEFIKGKQKQYKNFTVQIYNSLNIGYTNNDDEDNEKVGNFMPIMEYIGINRVVVDDDQIVTSGKTGENSMKWKQLNVKKNVEYYKDIQEKAFDALKRKYKINLRTSEAIFPLFCIFLDHVTVTLKHKYEEAKATDLSEVSMNVLGLFDIFYSFDEEKNLEIYDYQPNITTKLALKSDSIAGIED